MITRELVASLGANLTIDWTARKSAQAKPRVLAGRILKRFRYPPDKQELATKTVLEQAELVCKDWLPAA
ncbi:MAG: DUF3387 domain-containing protein [Thermaerobacter sp.]|jgi:type I restriction enzyme R subunit|nr:DUF3387 domain-containing protein [Thermaerobacter sp.]